MAKKISPTTKGVKRSDSMKNPIAPKDVCLAHQATNPLRIIYATIAITGTIFPLLDGFCFLSSRKLLFKVFGDRFDIK